MINIPNPEIQSTCPRCGAGVRSDGKCCSCNLQLPGFSRSKGQEYRRPEYRVASWICTICKQINPWERHSCPGDHAPEVASC